MTSALAFTTSRALFPVCLLAFAAAAGACADEEVIRPLPTTSSSATPAGDGISATQAILARDRPIVGITADELALFRAGDTLFDVALRDADGLGPLYTADSCAGCHGSALRGPGIVQKMSIVEADGLTPSMDQSALLYGNTIHPLCAGGEKTPVTAPTGVNVRVTLREGPPVVGRGYVEAIDDAEIERVASEQATRDDGIHGHPNHVIYASATVADPAFGVHAKGDVLIGRFGMKARVPTLDDFTADALQGDMGITSPLRPTEIPNPDGLTDDHNPGVDVEIGSVQKRAGYMRLLALPRNELPAAGRAVFDQAKCGVCHAPSLHTRKDYPIAVLADIDAPVFTDVLLHDMGDALADSVVGTDGEATYREWKTAPLIGMSLLQVYLHDGRAHSLDEAIRAHDSAGSEAHAAIVLYEALSDADRQALLDFVAAL